MNNGFDYDFINRYNSFYSPSTVHCANTGLSLYFTKYLLQQAISRYKFTLPNKPGWNKAFFEYTLFCVGYGIVLDTPKYGTIFQYGTIGGYDINYMPNKAIISNPALDTSYERIIGTNCVVIKMQPLFGSIMDIIGYYADLMALTSESIGTNILNTKLAYIFGAENRAIADSFKNLYDRVASGEPAVVADKKLFDPTTGKIQIEMFEQNLKQNYIANDLFESLKNIENKFYTDMGFNNANTEKKERLIRDEVNSNNEATKSKAQLWLDTIRESMNEANEMFGLNLDAEFASFGDATWNVQGGVTVE